jgi:hypothetical protein
LDDGYKILIKSMAGMDGSYWKKRDAVFNIFSTMMIYLVFLYNCVFGGKRNRKRFLKKKKKKQSYKRVRLRM